MRLLCPSAVLLVPLSALADAALVDRIAATVDVHAITVNAVEARARPLLTGTLSPEQAKQVRRRALDELIEERLIASDAEKLGLTVDDADVERAVAEVARQNQLSVEQLFAETKKQGISPDAYRLFVRRQLLSLRWLNLKLADATAPDEAGRAAWMAAQRAGLVAGLRAKAVVEVRP